MDLHLSPNEEVALQEVQDVLLSVLSHADIDAWMREATLRLKVYLGADKGFILLDPGGSSRLFTEGLTPAEVLTYPREVVGLDKRFGLWQRQLALRVWSRETLNRPHMEAYLKSPYYNEYIVPVRAYDAMGITLRTSSGSIATAMFHHDVPNTTQFGERGLRLLRLVEPALRAGVSTFHMYGWLRQTLFRLIDRVAAAVVIYDNGAGELHRNPSATHLLGQEPVLELRARHLAQSLTQPYPAGGPQPVSVVCTRRGWYALTAASLRDLPNSVNAAVMVTVEGPPGARSFGPDALNSLGLTHRQGEVATLLAQGQSDKDVGGGRKSDSSGG